MAALGAPAAVAVRVAVQAAGPAAGAVQPGTVAVGLASGHRSYGRLESNWLKHVETTLHFKFQEFQ